MSLYVKVFTNFYTHRKTMRLRAAIGDDAFWVPPRLWAYAAENQPDGDFSTYSDGELAGLIGYSKDATSMLQALLQAGFIDGNHQIHDWAEHNSYHQGFAARAKIAAKARWEKERTKERKSTVQERRGEEPSIASGMLVASTGTLEPPKAPAARSVPSSLEEVQFHAVKIGLPEPEALKFWNYYGSQGWKVGKNPMKDWVKAIAGWKVRWETERGTRNGFTPAPAKSITQRNLEELAARTRREFPAQ